MPSINRNSAVPYYIQVYEQLAEGIESGVYPAGRKLPSIRECAKGLGVSNTTIELAYLRLVEEGFVKSKRGSGYIICAPQATVRQKPDRPSSDFIASRKELEDLAAARESLVPPRFDFAYDAVDTTTFPYAMWARICREVFFDAGAEAACQYNDRQGLKQLRSEIARYLTSEYGIGCAAEQVLVMPTTRDLVSEIASLFEPEHTTFAMEEPGYDEVGKRLRERGYAMRKFPVHPHPAHEAAARALEGVDVVFCTPACQFPTNVAMPAGMRERLVIWARDAGAYVIDDEYGWEFQTGASRMPPLGALDSEGRVITIGTFSNSFTPAVCLSYAVLPPQLMLKWQAARRDAHPQVPWQTQAAMAQFMRAGHWRKHVRKVRTSMLNKRQALTEAIRAHMGGAVEVVEGSSSLFVLVKTLDGRLEGELIAEAAANDVKVYPTSRYWSGEAPEDWRYVLIGYAGIPLGQIDEGVKALADAWGMQDGMGGTLRR